MQRRESEYARGVQFCILLPEARASRTNAGQSGRLGQYQTDPFENGRAISGACRASRDCDHARTHVSTRLKSGTRVQEQICRANVFADWPAGFNPPSCTVRASVAPLVTSEGEKRSGPVSRAGPLLCWRFAGAYRLSGYFGGPLVSRYVRFGPLEIGGRNLLTTSRAKRAGRWVTASRQHQQLFTSLSTSWPRRTTVVK